MSDRLRLKVPLDQDEIGLEKTIIPRENRTDLVVLGYVPPRRLIVQVNNRCYLNRPAMIGRIRAYDFSDVPLKLRLTFRFEPLGLCLNRTHSIGDALCLRPIFIFAPLDGRLEVGDPTQLRPRTVFDSRIDPLSFIEQVSGGRFEGGSVSRG